MDEKHSRGPWVLGDKAGGKWPTVVGPNNDLIAIIPNGNHYASGDATAVAIVPELFMACRALLGVTTEILMGVESLDRPWDEALTTAMDIIEALRGVECTPGSWQSDSHTTFDGHPMVMGPNLDPIAIVKSNRATSDAKLIASFRPLLESCENLVTVIGEMQKGVEGKDVAWDAVITTAMDIVHELEV